MFYEFDTKKAETPWSMGDMHCHKNYELYILLSGERSMFIENTLYKVKPVSVILIPPFIMHKTEGENFYRVNVNYSDDYFSSAENEVFTKKLGKKIINIPEKEVGKINKILEKLQNYSNQKTVESGVFTRCLTYELMHTLCTFVKEEAPASTPSPKVIRPPVLTKILDYIDQNLNGELTIKSISENFYISRSYLCKLFRKYLGISVTQSVLNLRISKACKLLADGKKSVNEISELCGFSSANYFGLIFKKHIGLSPINYRHYQKDKR